MPRDIPVGNGKMLVNFDHNYQLRDFYFPHVGQENHAGAMPCRFGVWTTVPPTDTPERRRKRLCWSDQDWKIDLKYEPGTLATKVNMQHDMLQVGMQCCDVVDFEESVYVRRVEVTNQASKRRSIRLFHNNNFDMYGTKIGDTAYFDPRLNSLIHYRKVRYIMATWFVGNEPRLDEYATGTAGYFGAEGTWRDAEDGALGNNAIAQGAVDSTMMINLQLDAGQSEVVYMVLGSGKSLDHMTHLIDFIKQETPQGVIDRTKAYWRLWLDASPIEFPEPKQGGLSEDVAELVRRSLLTVRTQIDNNGAIIAANDSDIMQFSRDTYSYLWPRDGALVASALDDAGFGGVARSFYTLCSTLIEDGGFFLHKYNPDGSPASSWHPWVSQGEPQLPIQEDETALVIWALWHHYDKFKDIEFVRPLWTNLIQKAGDFMVRFRDPATNLPLPSYDLWEERWGVHTFTVASVYGGLNAAWHFAEAFGDEQRAETYRKAADEVREAACKYLWSDEEDRFLRRIVPLDHHRTATLMRSVMAPADVAEQMADEIAALGNDHVEFEYDTNIDSSMYAVFAMGMLDANDERVEKTMTAIEKRLWIKTPVGGVARYEDDYYHRTSDDIEAVPGNPWFICTLWLADWYIAKAQTPEELKRAQPILDWVASHALPSGVLAEQVHPLTNAPLSVSPLTWSHATVVSSAATYLKKLMHMSSCHTCGQPRKCLMPGEASSSGEENLPRLTEAG